MKFIHVSDLHIGKYLYGYSMAETDQPYWIEEFLKLVKNENVDAVVIAGDVYDRGIPPKEAINLLDDFITKLTELSVPVFIIAGNHDSGTRLGFGSRLFKEKNVYIAGELSDKVEHITLTDEFGEVTFWLVPYLFPAAVNEVLNKNDALNYDQAMRLLLKNQDIDFNKRNVIVSHQMVTDNGKPVETDGSEVMVGGVGNIDVSAYDGFDYVALGHIHAPQMIKRETVRYSGSPISYHFSKTNNAKRGPVIVEMKQKGDIDISFAQIEPLHPMREVKGKYADIVNNEMSNSTKGEYIRVVLTDDKIPSDAVHSLSDLFENKGSILMETAYEPQNRRTLKDIRNGAKKEKASIDEMFTDFYRERNNDQFPDEKETEIIKFLTEQVINRDREDKPENPDSKDIEALIDFVMKKEGE